MTDIYKQLAGLPPEKQELLKLLLKEQGIDLSPSAIPAVKRDSNRFPLSFAQQRLWFLEQFEPGSPTYNIPCVVRLTGSLNVALLDKILQEIISRHEVLRTTFTSFDNQPVQVIARQLTLPLNVSDIRQVPEASREVEAIRLATEDAQRAFDLSKGPLLRATLIRLGEREHMFVLTMHHIVSDGWSVGVLLSEIKVLYEALSSGKPSRLPELKVQYVDFAVWQRERLKGEFLEAELSYWKEQLSGSSQVLELTTDFARPVVQTSNGALQSFKWPLSLSLALGELCNRENCTMFMTLLAVFQTLLYRYTGQEDMNIGTPIANRNRAETELLIGFFINTLVLRGTMSGNPSFVQLLKRVREMTLGAYSHQDLPFETLVGELHPQRTLSHSPLFQVMFVLNNAPMEALELPGVRLTPVEIDNRTTKFDLILSVIEEKDGVRGKFEYNTDLFKAETIGRMIGHFRQLAEAVVRVPHACIDSLPMLTEPDRKHSVLTGDPGAHKEARGQSILDLFEAQVENTPGAIALVLDQEKVSYRELSRRSNMLAHYLKDLGVGPEVSVGLCVERSVETIVGLLGILKAGGVYVPLDPAFPQERLAFMIDDAQLSVLVTQERLEQRLPRGRASIVCMDRDWTTIQRSSGENPPAGVTEANLAYVIYTSGSTGVPKGVLISHGALAQHCLDIRSFYQLVPEDNVLQFAAVNFDASLEQILPTLISGASLILRGPDIWATTEFHQKVMHHDLTVINLPTAYWHQLTREWSASPDLIPGRIPRLVIVGGDQVLPEAVSLWQKTPLRTARLLNAYGPTEATITSTTFEIPGEVTGSDLTQRIPIGRPVAGRALSILDRANNPAPVGVPGELCIGGGLLARGYLHRADLTAEKFSPDPFSKEPGSRLYRTGDLARCLPEGTIEFLGRIDHQVKIRGFRIELGEIESALSQHQAVREIVVLAREDAPGEKRLVAYLVLRDGATATPDEFREFLKVKLPEYMVPTAFVILGSMPLTPVGKIDRRALPAPDLERPELRMEFVAPRTETERALAEIVAQVLGLEKVGVKDNFFDLGGHSMMATQVISRVRQLYQVDVPLRSLFESPTVEGLAMAIAKAQAEEMDSEELTRLLAEMEELSDEEAGRLLNDDTDTERQTKPL